MQTQTYLRSKCMDADIQSAIQKELKEPAHIGRLAHEALDKGGAFGIDTSYYWSRLDPPPLFVTSLKNNSVMPWINQYNWGNKL